ncbi:MAG: hypothetical protein ABSC92_02350 [Rhizomicrobium sp.]|jgi:hypothetical protein
MAETVVIAEEAAEDTGYRFSWSLAIAGGVAATAVTFFLLTLGAGFGLLLIHPVAHTGPSMPTFLTGGAVYFFAAQAFGFAVGGHLAGRLLGPIVESGIQEEFRAAAHGFVAWAVTILATLTVVAIIGLSAAGATTAALYGASPPEPGDAKTTAAISSTASYLVDVLFRPATNPTAASIAPQPATRAEDEENGEGNGRAVQAILIQQQMTAPQTPDAGNAPASSAPAPLTNPVPDDESGGTASAPSAAPSQTTAPYSDNTAPSQPAESGAAAPPAATMTVVSPDPRGEARRILEASILRGEQMTPDDHNRLITLVTLQAGIPNTEAAARIDEMMSDIQTRTKRDADIARKAASYASLWIALSLLFGAIVSVFAATSARLEDDRDAVRVR